MGLRLPSEIVVETVLPALRANLARALARRGMTQQAIAERLGVSQPAISKVLRDRVDVDARIADDPQVERVVDRIADGIAEGRLDDVDVLAEVIRLVRSLEDRGPVCRLHEEQMPALQGLGCDLCLVGTDSQVLAERDVLATVRRAVRRLTRLPAVAAHVPNVGTNVGTALPGAASADDVAAVPGRIYVLHGRLQVPAAPEFGASRHAADVVLAAHAADERVRGVINLRTSEALLAAADDAGMATRAFDAAYEGRRDRLQDAFEADGVPHVAYHEGAFGVEPIAYVLGEDAVEAADRVATLVEAAEGGASAGS